jgi:hypothetical protein
VGEDEINVGNWCMAIEAFLIEAGVVIFGWIIFPV